MPNKIENFNQKKELPDIHPGDTVKVYRKIKEGDKERIQVFEGLVIARKHGKGVSSTITVRRVVSRIGVEKIFPLHSPKTEKIEVVKKSKVRRSKLYYMRTAKGKKARLKKKKFVEEEIVPSTAEEIIEKNNKEDVKEKTNIEKNNTTADKEGVEEKEIPEPEKMGE